MFQKTHTYTHKEENMANFCLKLSSGSAEKKNARKKKWLSAREASAHEARTL